MARQRERWTPKPITLVKRPCPRPLPSASSNEKPQPGERAFPRGRGCGAAAPAFPVLTSRLRPPGVLPRGKTMGDAVGEHARLRCYPKLPVWVVEDHQEVSGRLLNSGAESREGQGSRGASVSKARDKQNLLPARVPLLWGKTPERLTWENRR